jgi:hypothetical protein
MAKMLDRLWAQSLKSTARPTRLKSSGLKDKKTEVELLAPEKKALSGNAADKVIDEIFTEYLDETIWKMIQVAQANFDELLVDEYGDDQRDMLRHYLSRAVADEEGDSDESLAEKAEEEYLGLVDANRKTCNRQRNFRKV